MKLIVCFNCNDVISLRNQERTCCCGESGGHYTDSLNAVVWGKAIPLGFNNRSFIDALKNRPDSGLGSMFEAFVIPKECPTVRED